VTDTGLSKRHPSLVDSALAVWGLLEASHRVLQGYWSVQSPLFTNAESSLDWRMWSQEALEFAGNLRTLPWWASILMLVAVLPAFLPFWVAVPALWRRRNQPFVLVAAAACFVPDVGALLLREPTAVAWQMQLLVGCLGGGALVWMARAGVPSSSWPFISFLVPSVLAQRWLPVLLILVCVQIPLAILLQKRRGQRGGASMRPRETAS